MLQKGSIQKMWFFMMFSEIEYKINSNMLHPEIKKILMRKGTMKGTNKLYVTLGVTGYASQFINNTHRL